MATKVLLKKSSVTGRIPDPADLDYGELALNYKDGLLYYKNSNNIVKSIGGSGAGGVSSIDQKNYIATASQTVFDVNYVAPYAEVYLNGSKLNPSDYTATSGTNIVLVIPASAGDEIDLIGFSNTSADSTTIITTAITANQTIAAVSSSAYRTFKAIIQATDSTSGKYHTTEILAISNGTSVNYTEYGSINITGICAAYSMDISDGMIRLLATPASANSTVFKIYLTLIAS